MQKTKGVVKRQAIDFTQKVNGSFGHDLIDGLNENHINSMVKLPFFYYDSTGAKEEICKVEGELLQIYTTKINQAIALKLTSKFNNGKEKHNIGTIIYAYFNGNVNSFKTVSKNYFKSNKNSFKIISKDYNYELKNILKNIILNNI